MSATIYKLYSSPLRSRLEMRAPLLEAIRESIEEIKSLPIWRNYPCLIADENGCVIEDNGVGK